MLNQRWIDVRSLSVGMSLLFHIFSVTMMTMYDAVYAYTQKEMLETFFT